MTSNPTPKQTPEPERTATPRTDAALMSTLGRPLYTAFNCISDHSKCPETELTAALARVAELEKERDELKTRFGNGYVETLSAKLEQVTKERNGWKFNEEIARSNGRKLADENAKLTAAMDELIHDLSSSSEENESRLRAERDAALAQRDEAVSLGDALMDEKRKLMEVHSTQLADKTALLATATKALEEARNYSCPNGWIEQVTTAALATITATPDAKP